MKQKQITFLKNNSYVILSILAMLCVIFVLNIYSFLVINKPVNGEVLVVEGWIPSSLLEKGAKVFNEGSYETIVAIGRPLKGDNSGKIEQTYAHRCKNKLISFGVPAENVKSVPVWQIKEDRTFTTAKAFNAWLQESQPHVKRVDVFTASVHGRKSWLLYRRALGDSIHVGIISATTEMSKNTYWFTSTRMTYLVLRNTLGYINALLFTF